MKNERNYISDTPKTREERLNHLITVLERVEQEQKTFNMAVWMRQLEEDDELIEMFKAGERVDVRKIDCGLAACALGWAALDPTFVAEGLYIDHDLDPTCKSGVDDDGDDIIHYGYEAGSMFFGINDDEAKFLFAPGSYYKSNLHQRIKPVHNYLYELNLLDDSNYLVQDRHYDYMDTTEEEVSPSMVINHIKLILKHPMAIGISSFG